MPTKWKTPLVSVSVGPRHYTKQDDWTKDGRKEIIIKLHNEGKTIKEIQKIMRLDHGLDASEAMYKFRFKKWGIRDHFTKKQRKFILREFRKNGDLAPVIRYKDTGERLDPEKLDRLWRSRQRYGDVPRDGEQLSPGGLYVSCASPQVGDAGSPIKVIAEFTREADYQKWPSFIKLRRLFNFPAQPILRSRENADRAPASLDDVTPITDAEVNILLLKLLEYFHIDTRTDHAQSSDPFPGTSRVIDLDFLLPMEIDEIEEFMRSSPVSSAARNASAWLNDGNDTQIDLTPMSKIIDTFSPMPVSEIDAFMNSSNVANIVRQFSSQTIPGHISPGPTPLAWVHDISPAQRNSLTFEWEEFFDSLRNGQLFVVDRGTGRSLELDSHDTLQGTVFLMEREYQQLSKSLEDLEVAMQHLKDFKSQAALSLLEHMQGIFQDYFGDDSDITIDFETDMCLALIYSGAQIEGLERLRRLCRVCSGCRGPEDEHTRHNYALLGNYLAHYNSVESNDEIFEAFNLALNGRDPKLLHISDERFDTTAALTLHYLARFYVSQGEYERALELAWKDYERTVISYGQEHALTLASIVEFALISLRIGAYEEAIALMSMVAAVDSKNLDAKHPKHLNNSVSLVHFYLQSGNTEEAMSICQTVQETFGNSLQVLIGVNHEVWDAMYNLTLLQGRYLAARQDYKAALRLLEMSVWIMSEKLYSPDNPLTLNRLEEMAEIILERGPVINLVPLARYVMEKRGSTTEPISADLVQFAMNYGRNELNWEEPPNVHYV